MTADGVSMRILGPCARRDSLRGGCPNRVQKKWTLKELHSLPDDGNTYELIHGELFVAPAPTVMHETIVARLTRMLDPYAAVNRLGFVYRPRAAITTGDDTEVEPDLMVRQPPEDLTAGWRDAPLPIPVVDVASDSTRRRDRVHKRNLFAEVGIPEYWMVDAADRSIRVVRLGHTDITTLDFAQLAPRRCRAAYDRAHGRVRAAVQHRRAVLRHLGPPSRAPPPDRS